MSVGVWRFESVDQDKGRKGEELSPVLHRRHPFSGLSMDQFMRKPLRNREL